MVEVEIIRNWLHYSILLLDKMQICNVCSEQAPKYKCPTCKIRYCSVSCYKRHKADTCLPLHQPAPITSDGKTASPTEPWTAEGVLGEDKSSDLVPLQRLQLLGESEKLRDLLCNPHLRQLMRTVDAAECKDDAMKAAMQEPLFVELADRCLSVVRNEEKTFTSD